MEPNRLLTSSAARKDKVQVMCIISSIHGWSFRCRSMCAVLLRPGVLVISLYDSIRHRVYTCTQYWTFILTCINRKWSFIKRLFAPTSWCYWNIIGKCHFFSYIWLIITCFIWCVEKLTIIKVRILSYPTNQSFESHEKASRLSLHHGEFWCSIE